MPNISKVFSKYTTKEGVTELTEAVQALIKAGKITEAEKLLQKVPKKDVKIGAKKTVVVDDKKTETVVKVKKEDFKVKKPKDISEAEAQEVLFKYNAYKITPKVLDDFNISKFKNKEDIAKFIDLLSKKYKGEIYAQKRGVQTTEQLKLLSTLIQKDPKNLQKTILSLNPGETLNAEWMYAARELMAAGMNKLDDMAKLVSSGKATDLQKVEFRQHMALMSEFQKIIKGVQTETARTFRQFQVATRTKQFSHVDLDDLNKQDLLIELGGGDEISSLAKIYLSSGTNNAKMAFTQGVGWRHNLKQSSNAIAEIFINSILSNPMTHIRNTAGNWVSQAIIQLERKAVARLHGGKVEGGVAAYEDIFRAYGKTMASQEMLRALSVALKGKSLKQIYKTFDELIPATHGGSKVELRSHQFSASKFNVENKVGANVVDGLGRILTLDRLPTKMLSVADNFFKNREFRAELYALALREAVENVQKGTLKEADAAMFIASRITNPTSTMVTKAKDVMLESVFQLKSNMRNDAFSWLQSGVQQVKGSGGYFSWLTNYYIPFTQTPINIARFVAERTPGMAHILTDYSANIAKGGDVAQLAKMKMQLGMLFYTSVASMGYFTANTGIGGKKITLPSADIDIPGKGTGGKYEMMKGFNFQPNQFRIEYEPGKFVNLNMTGLDPVTQMIATAGNLAKFSEMIFYNTGIDKTYNALFDDNKSFTSEFKEIDAEQMAFITMAFALSFGENLTNSTFLKGAGDAIVDIQNLSRVMQGDMKPGKWAKKWLQDYSKAFIPTGLKQVSKLSKELPEELRLNDEFRKISTEWKTLFESQLFNKNLIQDYNIFGKPINAFGFYNRTELSEAEKEVLRVMPKLSRTNTNISMNYKITDNNFNITFPMKDNEAADFKINAGSFFLEGVSQLMEQDYYKNADLTIQKALIKKTLSNSRSEAMKALKSHGGKDSNYPKSEFIDDINARSFDLFINKYKKMNEGDSIQPDIKESMDETTKQLNEATGIQ
jgi:hypothetical protein